MLKITTIGTDSSSPILTLEGKLLEPWVEELRRVCDEWQSRSVPLQLDLAAVTYVDTAGHALLRDLLCRRKAVIVARSSFVAALLERDES